MHVLDFLAFAVLWWTAAAMLAGGDHVYGWRDALVTLALIVLLACSFACMVAVAKGFEVVPSWWLRGVLHSVAIFAVVAYDFRFNIRHQLRLTRAYFSARVHPEARRA